MAEATQFKVDFSGVPKELLEQPLSGTIVVNGRTLKDAAENPTWKRENYKGHLTLEGATIGDVLLCAFSTSAWVRYQSRMRTKTKGEIDKALADPMSLADLLTRAERQAIDPVVAGMRAFGKMTPDEQLKYIANLQAQVNVAKAEQAGG